MKAGSIFTYGDTIHCLFDLEDDLIVHEQTHVHQQGTIPELWWQRYFSDKNFLISQEAEAYHNQYIFSTQDINDRNVKNRIAVFLANQFASSLYNNCVSTVQAIKYVKYGYN